MGVSIEAVITHRDLAFVRNMGSCPGDELEVVHPFGLFGFFPIQVADLDCVFVEAEPLQGQRRTEHVISHPLGLGLCFSPDPAMDIESRMAQGEKVFGPFRAQELFIDKIAKDLAGKKLSQPRIINREDLMEGARLIYPALGHQEMEVGVEIDPVAKALDGGNNAGHKLRSVTASK